MLAELAAVCELLDDALDKTEVSLLSGVDCAQLAELLAQSGKRCAALGAFAAARAAACGAHKSRGDSSPTRWLAQTAGVGAGEARRALEAANDLDDCPQTREALLAGHVSLAQSAEIAKTEKVARGSEAGLLDLAAHAPMSELKDVARRHRLAAGNAEDRYHRQREERYLRHWVDDDGMSRGSWALPSDVGVPLANRIDTEVDRLLRHARREHKGAEAEVPERVAADALTKLVLEGGKPKATSAELILVCDIAAFQRGQAEANEICHIIGGGPVPVTVARELAVTAFIKAVLHDGQRIGTIAHYGRHVNAKIRTALSLGEPPQFNGIRCVDCERRYGIQWDHIDPRAHHGPTSYENLAPRCWPCHDEKTRRDRAAGLLTPQSRGPDR